MLTEQTKLIIQALESAEKSLALAKKLLGGESVPGPGVIGKFDGESIVTEKGQKHYVSPNYASKSRLVVGDTLRMIGQGEKALFKQIEKKERTKVSGVLTKKDGQWAAVAAEGSFFVLPVSVQYFKGEIGDEVEIIIPKDYKTVKPKWAALEQVVKPKQPKRSETPKTAEVTKKAAVKKKPANVDGTEKSAEALKKPATVPKQPKSPKQPKEPKLEGESPEAVRGEIKVEEELR